MQCLDFRRARGETGCRAAAPSERPLDRQPTTQLQDYLDHLTIERGVAANTMSSYRRDLRRYAQHLTLRGIDDLAKVSKDDVSEFLVALRRGDVTRCRRCPRRGPWPAPVRRG